MTILLWHGKHFGSAVIHTTPVYVLLENAIHCIFHLVYIIWEYPAITYNTANLPQCLEDLYSTWCFSPASGIKAFKRLKIILCRLWLVLWFRGPKHCPGLLCSQVELYKSYDRVTPLNKTFRQTVWRHQTSYFLLPTCWWGELTGRALITHMRVKVQLTNSAAASRFWVHCTGVCS